jgi:sulfur carrier protein ThiS
VHVKIETMHQKIEVISTQVDQLLASVRLSGQPHAAVANEASFLPGAKTQPHRDILADEDPFSLTNSRKGGQTISPELQMQRLMAQLTAAYTRIAALEEQLMSQRLH